MTRAPLLVTLLGLLVPDVAGARDPVAACERAAAAALRTCVKQAGAASARCHERVGTACASDAGVLDALGGVARPVAKGCGNDAAVQAVGWGPSLTVDALVARLEEACRGETAALASRSFGGPHAAVLAGADDAGRRCVEKAYAEGRRLLVTQLRRSDRCIERARTGAGCDAGAVAVQLDAAEAVARARIEKRCPALADLIALDPTEFLARTRAQVRCLVATAHPDPSPFVRDCGPRPEIIVPPRGAVVQVVLDEAVWGTRCGDGTPYAFTVRLAPAGSPVENVVIHLQGGGVCLLNGDCSGVNPALFRAVDDGLPQGGWLSNDPAVNPFATWTKVHLPYCNQDLFAGGGTTSTFPSITVHRFGALNVRAALRWLRDVLWTELDATTAEGYRADRPRILFGGTSAGGFGVSYNYHYVLDDLRWPRTTAVPDSSLGLDNGGPASVRTLGQVFLVNPEPPLGWGGRGFLPPYCATPECAVVPALHAAASPRLATVPEQQILSVSNQVDQVQVSTTLFSGLTPWIDALRATYCATQGLPGLRYFLPADPTAIHGTIASSTRFTTLAAAGTTLRDWLAEAVTSPETIPDRVDEGTLVAQFGAMPFECPVGSAGGALVDG
jgi:hypothetical protein